MTRVLNSVVREALIELADEGHQRVAWTAASGPKVGSLTEAVERLLDDSGLGDALDKDEAPYQPETESVLRSLVQLLGQMDARLPPAELLGDPRMARVRELAERALEDPVLGRTR